MTRTRGNVSGGGGGMEIGEPVINGTPWSVLYIDINGDLAEKNPGFTFDEVRMVITGNNPADENTFIGDGSGNSTVTGYGNTGIGINSLEDIDTGILNLAIGYQSGLNIVDGERNTVLGYLAGSSIVNGTDNVAIGTSAGVGIENSINNIAIGAYSLSWFNPITGDNNIGIGLNSGGSLTDNANGNVLMGANAGTNIGEGNYNIIIGDTAGTGISGSAIENIAIGRLTLNMNGTTGPSNYNIAIGTEALFDPLDVEYNIALGYQALSKDGLESDYNIGIGYRAGSGVTLSTETIAIGTEALGDSGNAGKSGYSNIAMGSYSLYNLEAATDNIAIGHYSGYGIDSGSSNTVIGNNAIVGGFSPVGAQFENVAIGDLSLAVCESSFNTAVGYATGNGITTGAGNTVIGHLAGANVNASSFNTALGYNALESAGGSTNGDFNTAIGANAGASLVNSSYNTLVGGEAGVNMSGGAMNNAVLGYSAGNTLAGSYNVLIGTLSGINLTTGIKNTLVGDNTAQNLSTGSRNTLLGANAGQAMSISSPGISDYVFIGTEAAGYKPIMEGIASGDDSTDYFALYAGGNITDTERRVYGNYLGTSFSSEGIVNAPAHSTLHSLGSLAVGVFVSSVTTKTLDADASHYVYDDTVGNTATWSLPLPANSPGRIYYVKNRGVNTLTIDVVGGGFDIFNSSPAQTVAMTQGEAYAYISDGIYWNVF